VGLAPTMLLSPNDLVDARSPYDSDIPPRTYVPRHSYGGSQIGVWNASLWEPNALLFSEKPSLSRHILCRKGWKGERQTQKLFFLQLTNVTWVCTPVIKGR
jgi:hypothetical protein